MANMTSGKHAEKFSPHEELPARREVPECLYVVVDNVAFTTFDYQSCLIVTPVTGNLCTKLDFTCEDLTHDNLRTHLIHSICSRLETKFISVFEDEDSALQAHPFCASIPAGQGTDIHYTTMWIIDTSNLQAGWIDTCSKRIPVWLQCGDLPMIPKGVLYMEAEAMSAFNASVWICLDEVREILGLEDTEGHQGEWLACGFIPRGMVAAQVVLQDYQRRPDLAHAVPNQSRAINRSGSVGSVRPITSKEQEEHIREQILRNKASREDLRRAKGTSKRSSYGRNQTLLRQAMCNRQVVPSLNRSTNQYFDQRFPREDIESEVVANPSEKRAAHMEPQVEATSSVVNAALTESCDMSSLYACIRSPMLRQVLERKEASKFIERMRGNKGASFPQPQRSTEKRKNSGIEVPLNELSLLGDGDDVLESRFSGIQPPNQDIDEDTDFLSHSERLHRARAGKRKADFHAIGQNPGLKFGVKIDAGSASKGNTGNVLVYPLGVASSVSDEMIERRIRSALPGLQPPREEESTSGYAPSVSDEEITVASETPGYEADSSDNYDSAQERDSCRRTRRKSPHSRLTTPLSMYDSRHMPTRG